MILSARLVGMSDSNLLYIVIKDFGCWEPPKDTVLKTFPMTERLRDPEESETEYAESENSYADSTTSEDTCVTSAPAGPPKPPRLYLESSSSASSGAITSPPVPVSPAKEIPGGYHYSPPTRLNSTEIEG